MSVLEGLAMVGMATQFLAGPDELAYANKWLTQKDEWR